MDKIDFFYFGKINFLKFLMIFGFSFISFERRDTLDSHFALAYSSIAPLEGTEVTALVDNENRK